MKLSDCAIKLKEKKLQDKTNGKMYTAYRGKRN